MEAKDLRLGNLITDKWASESSAFVVTRITDRSIRYGANFSASLKDLKPLKLTEGWIKSLGFDLVLVEDNPFKQPKMPYWVLEGVCLFYNEGENNEGLYMIGTADQRMGEYSVVTRRWITEVHTLQNAFYAWTGRELELKK